jgi:hypothetical protein
MHFSLKFRLEDVTVSSLSCWEDLILSLPVQYSWKNINFGLGASLFYFPLIEKSCMFFIMYMKYCLHYVLQSGVAKVYMTYKCDGI